MAGTTWLLSAAAFLAWLVAPVVDDPLLRAEVGYLGAAALLCALLSTLYRRSDKVVHIWRTPSNTTPSTPGT